MKGKGGQSKETWENQVYVPRKVSSCTAVEIGAVIRTAMLGSPCRNDLPFVRLLSKYFWYKLFRPRISMIYGEV